MNNNNKTHSINFDWIFYVNYNEDLINNGIDTEELALLHWKQFGQTEKRLINESQCEGLLKFDWKYYISKYPDLMKNGITNKISAYKHWKQYGKDEMRFSNRDIELMYKTFDWDFYLNSYLDLKNSNLKTRKDVFKHWINEGKNEKRYIKTHNDFDWEYYISYYNLNDNIQIQTREDALEHYLNNKEEFPFKNMEMEKSYDVFDWEKYISYYNISEDTKDGAYYHWINTGKYDGYIFFREHGTDPVTDPLTETDKIENNLNKLGVAVSVYSNNKTSSDRILCSKICLNSIAEKFRNSVIIIVIDGLIQNNHMKFIKELSNNYPNISIYINNQNFGIAKTKNICIKLLEEYDIDYLCLLDDDIEIIRDLSDYVEDVFKKIPDIPLLSNYNPYLNYQVINKYSVKFIETTNYFGNLLIINRSFLKTYGYMAEFEYKWGDEHIEFTHRYLDKTPYKNFAVNFDNYIINEQIINGESTLHLHSFNINKDGSNKNNEKMQELLKNIQYIDFTLDKNEIKKYNKIYDDNYNISNLVVTIMAAGEGKRMKSDIPKVLHLFKFSPMLVRIINEVDKLDPKQIIVITGKFDKLIKDTLIEYLNNRIYKKIKFVKQKIANGTGGAIKSSLDKYSEGNDVLILNGDMPLINSCLLKQIVAGKINTLLVANLENPTGYGRILYDSSNKFIGIREEKDCSSEEKLIQTVNVGIYYFNSCILQKYIPMITNDNVQNEYYLTDFVKVIYKENDGELELNTFLVDDNNKYQILGVNTKEELEELEKNY